MENWYSELNSCICWIANKAQFWQGVFRISGERIPSQGCRLEQVRLRKVYGSEMEFYTIIPNVMDLYYVDLAQLEQSFTKFLPLHSSWLAWSISRVLFAFWRRSEQTVRLFATYTHCCSLLAHRVGVAAPPPYGSYSSFQILIWLLWLLC